MGVVMVSTNKILGMFGIDTAKLKNGTKIAYSADKTLVFNKDGVIILPFSKKKTKAALFGGSEWQGFKLTLETAVYIVASKEYSTFGLLEEQKGGVVYKSIWALLNHKNVKITGVTLNKKIAILKAKIKDSSNMIVDSNKYVNQIQQDPKPMVILPGKKAIKFLNPTGEESAKELDFLKFSGEAEEAVKESFKFSKAGFVGHTGGADKEALKKYTGIPKIDTVIPPQIISEVSETPKAAVATPYENPDDTVKGEKVKLVNCTKLYQLVGATEQDSLYCVVALRDDLKIAARFKGSKVSVRVEGNIAKYVPVLKGAGYTIQGSQTHASFHVDTSSESLRHKVVGAGVYGLCLKFSEIANDFSKIKGV